MRRIRWFALASSFVLLLLGACTKDNPEVIEDGSAVGNETPDAEVVDTSSVKDVSKPTVDAPPLDAAAKKDSGRDSTPRFVRAPTEEAFFGAARCPPGALFCEDFESGGLSSMWTAD